jgi:curved DNA-binding protein CbpA
MFVSGEELERLKHAYQVIGVSQDASAHSIKQTYRRLVKRWHPDLYVGGTTGSIEATQMTKLINEAYSAIADAPLRYYVDAYHPQVSRRSAQTSSAPTGGPIRVNAEKLPKTDKLEFWVRFVCGALVGIFMCFNLFSSLISDFASPNLSLLALGASMAVLGFGFGAARYGDQFWHSIFRRWWLWP